MCSRYTLSTPEEVLGELGIAAFSFDTAARYNVAPTHMAPVVVSSGGARVAELHRFGLIPSWADDPRIGVRLLNARSETAKTKPAFRDALEERRCLVAADGFIEWKRDGKKRRPHWFRHAETISLALAGVWERWRSGDEWLLSFAILTAPANDQVAPIHDRMPVILDALDHERWLATDLGADGIEDLLANYQSPLRCIELDTRINSVANDDPACLTLAPQGELF